ncbi:MAG: asparagine--tRNA ligase [Methanomicrobia archaeon]|nr:asparagine--tRNA ligase [Methanomicrobia archaeon]RLF95595.1 MAG: asparagine--tRNA ligase [Thermococci archaeon]
MKNLYVKNANDKIGKEIELFGWVYRQRVHGGVVFVILRDSTGIVQVSIHKNNVDPDSFNNAQKVAIESSIRVKGKVVEDSRAPTGIEIKCSEFEIISLAEKFPIQEGAGKEFLLDIRHLSLRSLKLTEIMKIKELIMQGAREYLQENDWHEVFPPIITSAACEGGTTLFSIDYYGREAYLSQSAQLYLETAIFSLEKVYSLTPSFRAEKSKTRRHLSEYQHLELEAAWMDADDIMKVEEELVASMCRKVSEYKGLERFGRKKEEMILNIPLQRIKYDEAIQIVQKKGIDIEWGSDFGYEEEKLLTNEFEEPFFVYNYPIEAKVFYMKQNPDGKTYACADLLAPKGFGEIIGGSQREDDLKALENRMELDGIDKTPYQWYLDLRRYGSVVHSGFGLGIERLLMWICNLEHIRDACLYPRTISRVEP